MRERFDWGYERPRIASKTKKGLPRVRPNWRITRVKRRKEGEKENGKSFQKLVAKRRDCRQDRALRKRPSLGEV
jgi:hypothetical protein